jgi:hypothetical protein
MVCYLRCATFLCVWFSVCHRKNLTFFSLSNIFTKSIYRVAIHIVSLHLLDQILGGEYVHNNSPILWRLRPSTKIFQQKSCPLVIQGLDSEFWISCGTQLQVGNGSYTVSCFDDDDDDVKVKMIPVIIGTTGTISRSLREYLSNI